MHTILPPKWKVMRMKFLCDINTGDKDTVNAIDDGKYPFYVRSQTVEKINSYTQDCEGVLTAGDGVGVGKVFHYFNGKFDFHQRVYLLNHFRNIRGKYLFYYLKENFYKVALDGGSKSTVDSLRRPTFQNFQITYPEIESQDKIIDFLDKETTRIDTLISKKQKQIELLNEKRQAIITQSVTKGLKENVKMKYSGEEWIGEIPEHWDVIKHSLVLKNLEQGWSPVAENKSVDPGEWGVVKISCISKGKFVQFENKSLIPGTEVRMKHQIRKGDLLMSRGNTVNLVGDVCLVDKIDYQLLFSDLVYRLKYQENKINKKYVMYFLLSQVGRYQISRDASGSSMTMAKISQENIKSWIITLPPLNEQNKITYEIDLQLSQIDVLKEKVTSSIELLKEYRSSLITHAVSGKIDISKYEVSK
jgi:type I restriction enzyme S subunit